LRKIPGLPLVSNSRQGGVAKKKQSLWVTEPLLDAGLENGEEEIKKTVTKKNRHGSKEDERTGAPAKTKNPWKIGCAQEPCSVSDRGKKLETEAWRRTTEVVGKSFRGGGEGTVQSV